MNGEGVGALFERLSAVDPEGAALVNPADATRVRRAFEIFMTTGLSIAEWFKRPMVKKLPEARFLAIRLLPEKAVLDRRCNLRFDIMTASGALEEVAGLLARQVSESLPVMKAKGCRNWRRIFAAKPVLKKRRKTPNCTPGNMPSAS